MKVKLEIGSTPEERLATAEHIRAVARQMVAAGLQTLDPATAAAFKRLDREIEIAHKLRRE